MNTAEMNVSEREFLLKEFETAWSHLGSLETRRFEILQYYSGFFGVYIGAIAVMFQISRSDNSISYIFSIFSSLMITIFSFSCSKILQRERDASERYRNKINSTRKVFLLFTNDLNVIGYRDYIGSEDIGHTMYPMRKKKLNIVNLNNPKEQSTALYINLFIFTGMVISSVILITSIYLFIINFISGK
jgi:uncharacterized membrane protein